MKKIFLFFLFVAPIMILTQCSTPEWQKKNNELIKQYSLTGRELKVPNTKVESNLEPGKVTALDSVASVELYPGVNAKLYWGKGAMTAVLQMAPNAQIAEEELPNDRFLFVMEGEVNQVSNGTAATLIALQREEQDGTHSQTPRVDFIYLEKGTKSALTAGPNGAKVVEVYSPVRLDYMEKAGVSDVPSSNVDLTAQATPNVEPGKVYDLYNLQLTELVPGANSRLITGKNVQVSFISMDPKAVFDRHIHPEEQTMLVLRGSCDEILLDGQQTMNKGDVVLIPGNMVHGATMSDLGCDAIDIFWPARTDYSEKEKARLEAYHAIIPEGAKPELLVDGVNTKPGLIFAEGPKWMNGKVYFSNMGFDQGWGAHPDKSAVVELSPDGSYRNISQGKMQTNGLYPYKNGNLLVCDMIGHRVIEMTTEGKVVRVVADKYDGKKIDGPNDIITDTKGGIYFTDPQFTMEAVKFQPGRAVYYVTPEGKVIRVTEPNEFAMPNGILLSPDGKTLYINNCYDDESWYPVNSSKENYVWAYDVNEDGTISNGRQFAKLFLVNNVLDRKGKSSSSDGMAIDKNGNIYVGTYYGVQIFNAKGEFVGMINTPHFPVSLCFGDDDMKTLYIVSYQWVYKIRTNQEGYVNYL
ncbi:MAG TPA: SMP-30/gluconolactonase/LRE family protein [Bacteroidales bacterium]|nr:SMP-30/gluconolactonase/LRE family protein [Bacteroidales bacterium]